MRNTSSTAGVILLSRKLDISLIKGITLLLAQTLPSVSASADISPLSGEYLKGKV